MKIAIRSDGGINIGMGHIMRTLNLAKELAKFNEVFYICKSDVPLSNKYLPGINKIKECGFEVKIISEKNIYKSLNDIYADYLITDSYDVNDKYFSITKNMFKKTIYIDDLNLFKYDVDILINQNIYAKDLNYTISKGTKFLLGTEYLMIRDEFRNCTKKIIKKEIKDILITVGGSDIHKLTESLIDYIRYTKYNYHIVIGPSFEEDYKKVLKNKKSKNIIFYENADMYSLMNIADLAISSCGSTLYELAACGVPTLGIIIVDNQIKMANKFSNMKIISNLGWYNTLNRNKIIEKLEELHNNYKLREIMSNKGYNLVDGKGVNRIVNEILN